MRYEARDVHLESGAIVNIIVHLGSGPDGKQYVSSIESFGRIDGTPLSPSDHAEVGEHILGRRNARPVAERESMLAD